jgi:coiled-coil domain-containing protein 55
VLHNASTRDVDALNEESARMMMTMMMTCEEEKQSSFRKVTNSSNCSPNFIHPQRTYTYEQNITPSITTRRRRRRRRRRMDFTTKLKYGLNPAAKASSSKNKKKPKLVNLFANDESSDEENDDNRNGTMSEAERAKKRHNEEIKRQQEAAQAKGDAEAKEIYEKALKEDPNVFAYDDALTDIEKGREATLREKDGEKIERKSRYIAQLKEAADFRKREQDVTYERRLMKEREKEDELYGDKEKFITSAYRKKLEEDEKWKKEELEREQREKEREVQGKSDMTSFYANLMNRNVATGGDTATHSRKAPEPKLVHSPTVVAQNEKKEEEKAKAIETIDQKTKVSRGDENKLPAHAIERTTGDDKRLVEEKSKDNVQKEAAVREQVAAQKQVDREEKAKSARERYLARKRKDLDS